MPQDLAKAANDERRNRRDERALTPLLVECPEKAEG
jgi:hypothetical protein